MHRSIVRRILTVLLTIAAVAPWLLSGVGSASAVTDVDGLQAVTDGASAGALVADAPARELRSIYPGEWGAPRPDGVAILPDGSSTLVVGDDERLVKIAPTEDLLGSLELPAGVDVRDIGIDPVSGRFVIEDANELVWGRISSTSATQSDTLDDLGLVTPAGLTFDAAGNLLTRDAATESIVNLGRPTTALDKTPTGTPLPTGVGIATEGLAFNPADGLVYVTNIARDKLYGVDTHGVIHAAHDLSGVGIVNLTGMSFGPSADPTDDPATTSLYVADAGDATTLGRVAEISLAADVALAAPSVTATLVRQTNTWQWNPASPDPAGVTYLSTKDRLIVVDSEVDEPTGAGHRTTNLWETTRAGSVTTTGNTLGYTQEPTGAGFDPVTATLFISTDARQDIHMVRPGGDNRYGTSDDQRTMFDTAKYGLGDTEDPAFDTAARHLFFVDGVGREVYRLNPGTGGVIGDGNDTVTHFDVGQYSARDTEALAYNPNTDTLYVGEIRGGLIYEVTKSGALVRTIDVSGVAALDHISGLGVGPSSDNASMTSIYIVDRAVDNGSNGSENDGKLFEFRAPGGTS
ncbi:MAG TPA: hypothetical protein VEC09_08255, partial [Actinomycetota bacterium]|nr:hypothetical protein [Actinomycetota bacterium]